MAAKSRSSKVDDLAVVDDPLVQLARLALAGREQDVSVYLQRTARRIRSSNPELADALVGVLREAPTRSSPLRRASTVATPVDAESRLALVRVENPPEVEHEPILPSAVARSVDQLIEERRRSDRLERAGLAPTRTALLVGPPGVGKTMAARWMAAELGLPLLLLDLSAVMSSLLGKTGVNLRHVLDYAKSHPCLLLIDELDSIAKRRNDESDVGELKRLVNVLLQQLDDWPPNGGLLLGATNHPELLDPAVWRRFETVVEFRVPDQSARAQAILRFSAGVLSEGVASLLARMMEGRSFSEIESEVQRGRRAAALLDVPPEEGILEIARANIDRLPASERRELAVSLVEDLGVSQRKAHEVTGVSRDTIRRQTKAR